MAKSSSAANPTLGARFDQVRDRLLQDRYADRLSKPLEFWVLPSDRRLPLALLGRTLQDLLATPFDELSATPGIGEKKIHSLVKLLDRATNDDPPMVSVGTASATPTESAEQSDRHEFDPQVVSEALWSEWRSTVRAYGVEDERLGYLAPSLQQLPTVIWQTPLRQYLDHSLAEIRRLRTHGEKRVRCVLEVFHSVTHRLEETNTQDAEQIHAQLTPSWIRAANAWIDERLRMEQEPGEAEVKRGFVRPLLELIEVDCGTTVARLVAERLGLQGEQRSVREQSRALGVTRARVYQLLDDCGKVMAVRWPNGRQRLEELTRHFSVLGQHHDGLYLFHQLADLCFPSKQADHAFLGVDDGGGYGQSAGSPVPSSPVPSSHITGPTRLDAGELDDSSPDDVSTANPANAAMPQPVRTKFGESTSAKPRVDGGQTSPNAVRHRHAATAKRSF